MNIEKIRSDFPVSKKYAYLDSACMALKPKQVAEAMQRYYLEFPACGERSSHKLGNIVTREYDEARKAVAKFIGAEKDEIVFTKNTTEGLNLAANSLLQKGDCVLTSDKEHNSNLLPWLKFNHSFVRTENGQLDLDELQKKMSRKVKLLSLVHSSNIDGVSFPVREAAKIAHEHGAFFVLDAAQSVPHMDIDVKKIGCDIMAFSGHKMLGPSIGCVYIKKEVGKKMQHFMTGGGTVSNVIDGVPTFLNPPESFEAGLQNYAGAIGLHAAVDYLNGIGMKNVQKHEEGLNKIITEGLLSIKNVSIISPGHGGITSFNIKGMDAREAAIMLDSYDVLVRGGYHCCHNWFNANKIAGSVRSSLYIYNNEADAEALVSSVKKIAAMARV